MAEIAFDVQVEEKLDELVDAGVRAIVAATERMADDLRERHIPDEAPQGPSGALSSTWEVRERDPLTRIVFPPDDAWYAHIVARGRTSVRPTRRRALTIDGAFAAYAGPTDGDPFVDRAVAAAEHGADQMIAAALSAEGIGT